MPTSSYGNYVYFKNSIDAPKQNNNKFILNQEPDFYITSLSNLMDETLTLVPNLFVNKMVKMDDQTYQGCVSVIKFCITEQRKSTNGTNGCGKRKREKYFELC